MNALLCKRSEKGTIVVSRLGLSNLVVFQQIELSPVYTILKPHTTHDFKFGTDKIWAYYIGSLNSINLSFIRTKPKMEHSVSRCKWRVRAQNNILPIFPPISENPQIPVKQKFPQILRKSP